MIPLNHKVEIEFGELMELVDKAKKLEELQSRSCEGCKYSKEEMDRLTKKTLQLISPKRGDKYSPNLYKWLVENFREREFETKVFVNSDGIRFIGFFDDAGWFLGASLMGVLRNGEKEKPRPVPPIRVKDYREIEGFWNAYEKDGVVTITPPPRPLPDIPVDTRLRGSGE